jgi:hypothetical protein
LLKGPADVLYVAKTSPVPPGCTGSLVHPGVVHPHDV